MEYIEILSTALYWYAIGGVALLIVSIALYVLACVVHSLLVRLGALIGRVLEHTAGRLAVWSKHHHPAG
mgnify:FL=1|jgi:hypothetical protein